MRRIHEKAGDEASFCLLVESDYCPGRCDYRKPGGNPIAANDNQRGNQPPADRTSELKIPPKPNSWIEPWNLEDEFVAMMSDDPGGIVEETVCPHGHGCDCGFVTLGEALAGFLAGLAASIDAVRDLDSQGALVTALIAAAIPVAVGDASHEQSSDSA